MGIAILGYLQYHGELAESVIKFAAVAAIIFLLDKFLPIATSILLGLLAIYLFVLVILDGNYYDALLLGVFFCLLISLVYLVGKRLMNEDESSKAEDDSDKISNQKILPTAEKRGDKL